MSAERAQPASVWIPLDGEGPLYLQIYRMLRQAILTGELRPGLRLPPTRALSRDLGVSRNVVLLAYEQLHAEGYVEGRVGAGTFVASPLPEMMLHPPPAAEPVAPPRRPAPRLSGYGRRAVAQQPVEALPAAPPPRVDFRYGDVTLESQSLRHWRRLLMRHAERPPVGYGPAEGHPELRRELAAYVGRRRGVACEPHQVIVVSGSQQAIDLTARTLLDPGDRVLLEEPHYQGARQAFLAAGAELMSGPVDGDGLCIAAVPGSAKLAYVTPSHQFPTGAVMPLGRRLELLEWAAMHRAYVLEDDYDSEYRYQGRPLEAVYGLDRRGRTIYVGTLSKVLFPALRLGFLVLPEELIESVVAAKWLADRQTASFGQAVLADFIAEGHFERHLRRMRTRNGERRRALLGALAEHLGERVEISGINAGVHLLLWLRDVEPARVGQIIAAAAARDVGVYPVTPYFLKPPRRAGLMLGYATLTPEQIRVGVERLAEVL